MMQLLRLINGLLEKHPESRSRKLAAHAPIIVPVYSQVPTAVYLNWWQAFPESICGFALRLAGAKRIVLAVIAL